MNAQVDDIYVAGFDGVRSFFLPRKHYLSPSRSQDPYYFWILHCILALYH